LGEQPAKAGFPSLDNPIWPSTANCLGCRGLLRPLRLHRPFPLYSSGTRQHGWLASLTRGNLDWYDQTRNVTACGSALGN